MIGEGGVDARLARELLARGLVSEKALVHAQAVRERGFASATIGDLLVELEHIDGLRLVETLSDVTGAAIWDGKGLDVELSQSIDLRRANAVVVRRDALTVWFASTDPRDETLREDVRFAAGSRRADPLVARADVVAWARGRARPFDEGRFLELLMGAPVRDEQTPASVRLANLILLRLASGPPGACARVEAFDEPAVRWGACGAFPDASAPALGMPRARATLEDVIRRLKHMAGLPGERGDFAGWIHLRAGRDSSSFELLVQSTARGGAAVLVRRVPWQGAQPATGEGWQDYRERQAAVARLAAAAQVDECENAMRRLIELADQLGSPAVLEQVSSRCELAAFLGARGRVSEGRGIAARAAALTGEHELGRRAEASVRDLMARMEVDDLERRASLFDRVAALLAAPGLGRGPTAEIGVERAWVARAQQQPEQGLGSAVAAIEEDRRWLGSPGCTSATAFALASIAEAELGRGEDALRSATTAVDAAVALDLSGALAKWALGRAHLAIGHPDEALRELRTARESARDGNTPAERLWIDADLAQALDDLGHTAEARSTAERALRETSTETGAMSNVPRTRMAALMRRAGPYR